MQRFKLIALGLELLLRRRKGRTPASYSERPGIKILLASLSFFFCGICQILQENVAMVPQIMLPFTSFAIQYLRINPIFDTMKTDLP